MRYKVTFTQYYEYEVEAETENEAEDIAYKEFEAAMRCPIANTWADEIEVDSLDDDEEEDDYDD